MPYRGMILPAIVLLSWLTKTGVTKNCPMCAGPIEQQQLFPLGFDLLTPPPQHQQYQQHHYHHYYHHYDVFWDSWDRRGPY